MNMRSTLLICLLGASVVSVVNAEVYIKYRNNTGTYTNFYPDTRKNTSNEATVRHSNNRIFINGVDINTKTVNTASKKEKNSEPSIIDMPTEIKSFNINDHVRGNSNVKKSICTVCDGMHCTSCLPDVKPMETDPNEVSADDCCYISQPRNCTKEVVCRTKIIYACGERCKKPHANEEIYYKGQLQEEIKSQFVHIPTKYSKTRHPYAALPFRHGEYIGNRFTIPAAPQSMSRRLSPRLQPQRRPASNRGYNPFASYRPRYSYGQPSRSTRRFNKDRLPTNLHHFTSTFHEQGYAVDNGYPNEQRSRRPLRHRYQHRGDNNNYY